jgi:hypothetical protein
MDMVEFLGNAGSAQLLALLAFPAVGALLFGGLILFSVTRGRRKKAKMKHGIQPKEAAANKTPPPAAADDLNISILSRFLSSPDPAAQPDPNSSPAGQARLTSSSNRPASPANTSANSTAPSHTETAPMPMPDHAEEAKIDLTARLGGYSPAAPANSTEPQELLRLLRHPQSGRLLVEVGGQRYEKLADITDKQVGQYVLSLVAHLLAFTNGMIATGAGLKSVYMPKVDRTPEPMARPTPVSQLPDPLAYPAQPASAPPQSKPEQKEPELLIPKPSPEAEAAFQASLRAAVAKPEPPPKPRGLFGRSNKPEEESLLPKLNLAEEIDKIVQARLLVSPLANTTALEISSDEAGGIRIKVNGAYYASPDDIPDPEIKELIKASIKQWERS